MSCAFSIPAVRLITALFLLLTTRPSYHEKTFVIRHESVNLQIADVVIMVEMAETTTDQKMLELMKTNTIDLLSQLQIGIDQVRVALIAIGEDKNVHANPSLRQKKDYEGVVVATLNEGTSLDELKKKIDGMKIYKYAPCSLAEEAAKNVILQEKNGDRPDVPNILIYMTSFCCIDTKNNHISEQIMSKWQYEKTFLAIIALVYKSIPVGCSMKESVDTGRTLANDEKHFALLDNFDFKKIGTLEVLKRAIACQQIVHVEDCGWTTAGAGSDKCARLIRIDDLAHKKCKEAIATPHTPVSYFGSNPLDCVEAIVATCSTTNKKYVQILKRKKIPQLDDENLDIDAQEDLNECTIGQPLSTTCPKTTTTIKVPLKTASFVTTQAINTTESIVATTAALVVATSPIVTTTTQIATTASDMTTTSIAATSSSLITTSVVSTTTSTPSTFSFVSTTFNKKLVTGKSVAMSSPASKPSTDSKPKTWLTVFFNSTCDKAKNDSCYSLLTNLENIDELLRKGLKKMGCSIDAIDVQRNMNVEAKKKLCQDLDLMRICKPWLDKLELSPYDVCPGAEDGYYRSILSTEKESNSNFPWWILAVVFVVCFLVILLVVVVLVRRRKQKKSQGRAIASKATKNRDRGLTAELSDRSAISLKNADLGKLEKAPSDRNKSSSRPKSLKKKLGGNNVNASKSQKSKFQEKVTPKQSKAQPTNSGASSRLAGVQKTGSGKSKKGK